MFKRPIKVPFGPEIFSSLLGGIEGGLATTTAIVAGLFISTESRELVVTTAIITFLVQAFNGAAGRYSSERTQNEIERTTEHEGYRVPLLDATAQLVSHVSMGMIVILPIIFVTDDFRALIATISLTVLLLFWMGAYKAHVVKGEMLRDGFELVVIGSMVISVGILAGIALS